MKKLDETLEKVIADVREIAGSLQNKSEFEDWLEKEKGYDLGGLYAEFAEFALKSK